jgi:hypothetical protein
MTEYVTQQSDELRIAAVALDETAVPATIDFPDRKPRGLAAVRDIPVLHHLNLVIRKYQARGEQVDRDSLGHPGASVDSKAGEDD